MSEPLIEFRGVQKAFGEKVVYTDLNLSIYEGESLTIIGGSGQGKSVMLKMLIGLLTVDGGEILFRGQNVVGLDERGYAPIRRKVQMLFQGAALFDSMTVRDNVAYGIVDDAAVSASERAERIAQALEYVGLSGSEDLWPTSLSSGMKKRVALARAIAVHPEVLLYDEPTTGLDPVTIGRIVSLISHLQRTLNVTSIVVTHDMPAAFELSDRIAMIKSGEVIFNGTPAQLVASDDERVQDFVKGNAPEDEDTESLLRSAG